MAGRLTLVKFIVQNMFSSILSIYSWLVSFSRIIQKACRNFIWSDNIHDRKLVAWKKICQPILNGGLRLRSLVRLNEDSKLKLG